MLKKSLNAGSAGLLLFVFSQVFWGCAASLPAKTNLVGPKTYKHTMDIRVNGFRRTYRVHIPARYRPEKPFPLRLCHNKDFFIH